jgi:hypothetical protein
MTGPVPSDGADAGVVEPPQAAASSRLEIKAADR